MKHNRSLSEWLNDVFFVEDKKTSLVIGLVSAAIGLAVDIVLYVYVRMHEDCVLRRYDRVTNIFIRYVACLGACMIVYFAASGSYTCWKRHVARKGAKRGNTRTDSKETSSNPDVK